MATEVERLAVLIEANTKSYERAMTKLQSQTERAIRNSGKSFDQLNSRLQRITGTLTRTASAFGLAFGGRAIVNGIARAIKAGEEIGDTAQKLGVTAEAYQELSFAADQNGASSEALVTAFRAMNKVIGEAERGSKTARAEFAALGIEFAEIRGKRPEEVFTLILDRIGRIEDPLQRNAELLKMFGRSGLEMAGMAAIGAKGLDDLRHKARELGIVLSNETIAKAQEGGDVLGVLSGVFKAAGTSLAVEFLPAFRAFAELVTSPEFQAAMKNFADRLGEAITWIRNNIETVERLAVAVVAMRGGAAIGGALGRRGALIGGALGGAVGFAFGSELLGGITPAEAVGGKPGMQPLMLDVTHPTNLADALAKRGEGMGSDAADDLGQWAVKLDDARDKVEEVVRSLEEEAAQLGRTSREQAIYNELARAGVTIDSEAGAIIAEKAGHLHDMKEAIAANIEALDRMRSSTLDVFSSIGHGIAEQKNGLEILTDVWTRLRDRAIDYAASAANDFLFGAMGASQTGLIGGLLSFLFRATPRAAGGPVIAGQPYLVGERRPEIFVPNVSGRIANMDRASTTSGGGGRGVTVGPIVIETRDAESFMKSRGQVESILARAVARGMRLQ